jgi:hypothetical protein
MQRLFDPDDILRTHGRMPFIASGIDAVKNVGATMNLGYNMASAIGGDGFRKGFNIPKYGTSVGGILTLGGLAVPGAIAGAAIGAMAPGGTMMAAGAAVGAGIGLTAPLAVGAAGYGMERLGRGVVNAFKSTALDAPGGAAEAGSAFAAGVGKIAGGIGKGALAAVNSGAAAQQVGLLRNLGNHIVNFKETAEGIEDVTLGHVGHAMMNVSMGVEAAKKAFNTYNTIHMGQMDGQVRRATPMVPAYADNAGATGDLVFALNRNRRG